MVLEKKCVPKMAGMSLKDAAKKAGISLPFEPILMPEVKDWLSLKVSSKSKPSSESLKTSLLISIPKKTVRLSTRRNRLKRLIREAFRKEGLVNSEKIYQFRVIQDPGDPGFHETRDRVEHLIKGLE